MSTYLKVFAPLFQSVLRHMFQSEVREEKKSFEDFRSDEREMNDSMRYTRIEREREKSITSIMTIVCVCVCICERRRKKKKMLFFFRSKLIDW